MDRPEVFRERLQRRRQADIGRYSVGPQRVAAVRRDEDAAQDRHFRIGIDKGHVGMPAVGAAARRIDFEYGGAARLRRIGRMGDKLAEARREALLPGVVEMILMAEKYHLVFRQRRLDRGDSGVRQVAGKLDIADLGADAAGKRANVKIAELRAQKRGHENCSSQGEIGLCPATYRVPK
jgi:hypothetical protein